MKYFRSLVLAISLVIATVAPSSGWTFEALQKQIASDTHVNSSWQQVVDYAKENLLLEGQLLIKSDGFAYLKVDDEYIHTLFPMLGLEEDGFKKPPYFRSKEAPGAHISVFYEKEHVFPEEIGQYFHFKLKQIVIVKPSKDTSYAVLQVEAPELENLRKKYGLSPKLFGHEYHISLAKKTTAKGKGAIVLESVVKPAPWVHDEVEPSPLPKHWKKHQAEQNILIYYLSQPITIPKGDTYFTYKGKVAIGWHGTLNPPRDML